MSTAQKPYVATGVLRVLFIDGYSLLIVFPLPLGLWAAYEARTTADLSWFWVVGIGVGIASVTALSGALFLWLGATIVKYRVKKLGYRECEEHARHWAK